MLMQFKSTYNLQYKLLKTYEKVSIYSLIVITLEIDSKVINWLKKVENLY